MIAKMFLCLQFKIQCRRHSLGYRQKTSLAQRLPKDLEERITKFYADINNLKSTTDVPMRLVHHYATIQLHAKNNSCSALGNMDETPMFFDMVPGKTLSKTGVKTVKVEPQVCIVLDIHVNDLDGFHAGSEKRHVTVVLTCSAEGHFPPPMIIFKGETSRQSRICLCLGVLW